VTKHASTWSRLFLNCKSSRKRRYLTRFANTTRIHAILTDTRNQDEIRTLVKKRSDFEHKVLARGTHAVDFARYAAWEIGLESLRAKRCKRLRIKGSTAHTGQARIFGIFDRGTKKHPGDVALWMSYLEYTRTAKANKKFKTILTAAIRLHPTKSELWLYAARWTLESEADMNGARSYMQRGTRFCTTSKDLWIEYAKLEMIYLAKIAMRRKILGLDVDDIQEDSMEIDETADNTGFATSDDMIGIPEFKTNSIRPSIVARVEVDSEAAKDPMITPALNGAIPLAIFDAARKQPFFCASAAEAFFDMFAAFSQVRCLSKILQHVLDTMVELYPIHPSTCNSYTRQPIVGISPLSAEFAVALGVSLARLKESMGKTKNKAELTKRTRTWTEPILELEGLDPGIKVVLQHMQNLQ
jgi:U3 small nucleolar RNA-associated protein 6